VFSHSAGQCQNIAVPIGGEIGLNSSTRSTHQQGNQGGHVPPEEAESGKRGKFIETPTLTSQPPQRNTPPSLSCRRGWAMGKGKGQARVKEMKNSTF